jgi:hypothetical protein
LTPQYFNCIYRVEEESLYQIVSNIKSLAMGLNHLCEAEGVSLQRFRLALGILVVATVAQRWPTLEAYYSNAGVLPLDALRAETEGSRLHGWLCMHGWHGSVAWAQALSVAQVACAGGLAWGGWPRLAAAASFLLYASCTMRNVQLAFILDR